MDEQIVPMDQMNLDVVSYILHFFPFSNERTLLLEAQLLCNLKYVKDSIPHRRLTSSTFKSNQGSQGAQKLSYLKSLKIQNSPPIPGVFTPPTIRNGFLIKI